jgi:adenine-specific DNA-methyltransferase
MGKYEELSKEELIRLAQKQEKELKTKKYGLVWDSEKEPEKVVLDCENNLPVLERVKDKEIKTNEEEDNILIEGDNYHALTVLNYTHKEKIDVIYIDPPYNTGNKDFIYNDKYVDKEDGYRHSKWLNFMEKRLNLAKNILKNNGVLFISIDDNELAQLKLLCDKIFGDQFVAVFPRSVGTVPKTTEGIQTRHDYVLCYAKENSFAVDIDITEEHFKFNDDDGRGVYALIHPIDSGTIHYSKSLDYPIKLKGKKYEPGQHIKNKPSGKWLWRWSEDLVKWGFENNLIIEKNNRLYTKNYRDLKVKKVNGKYKLFKKEIGKPFTSDTLISESFGNRVATRELKDIFPNGTFTYPKPTNLVNKLITMTKNNKSAIILDFFAGSGTTGHAVLKMNEEDGGKRKFILCTNNENKICEELTYPRFKKVINGYGNNSGLKGNLQYFKTNFVKKTNNRDQVKLNLTQECTEMLCVKEGIFNIEKEKDDFKIFSSNKKDKFLCIYYNFIEDSFNDFLKEIRKLKGRKHIYIFSLDNKVDEGLFFGIKDLTIEAIPQKILDVYKQLVRLNIGNKNGR